MDVCIRHLKDVYLYLTLYCHLLEDLSLYLCVRLSLFDLNPILSDPCLCLLRSSHFLLRLWPTSCLLTATVMTSCVQISDIITQSLTGLIAAVVLASGLRFTGRY